MISLLSVVALGFFLGMRHATDPDHVIAVTTIVARHRKIAHAALIGALWGLGHTLTIFVVGGGIILFGWVIPERVGLSMELSVGLMLVLLGVLNLTGFFNWISHAFTPIRAGDGAIHSHSHDLANTASTHSHERNAHPDSPDSGHASLGWLDRHFGQMGFYQVVRPLVVGLVHGLAGSAAVALLVLTTIGNPRWAMVYLLIFGVGTIAGMTLITGSLILPFAYADKRYLRLNRGLRVASGLISVTFGLYLVYQIGFVAGLFTGHPHWTPR